MATDNTKENGGVAMEALDEQEDTEQMQEHRTFGGVPSLVLSSLPSQWNDGSVPPTSEYVSSVDWSQVRMEAEDDQSEQGRQDVDPELPAAESKESPDNDETEADGSDLKTADELEEEKRIMHEDQLDTDEGKRRIVDKDEEMIAMDEDKSLRDEEKRLVIMENDLLAKDTMESDGSFSKRLEHDMADSKEVGREMDQISYPEENDRKKAEPDQAKQAERYELQMLQTQDSVEQLEDPSQLNLFNDNHQEEHSRIEQETLRPVPSGPMYTLRKLFPVRYESPPLPATAPLPPPPLPIIQENDQPTKTKRPQCSEMKAPNTRVRAIPKHSTLTQQRTTKAKAVVQDNTFKLKYDVQVQECQKLRQRNERLKTETAKLYEELQRTTKELARVQTENQLYAQKMPQLHAELLQENAYVDASNAQTTQLTLELTQLRAKVQVFQTRHHQLEAQNAKYTKEVRELRKEVQRKTSLMQQQSEKLKKLEQEYQEKERGHAHDRLQWKTRMQTLQQRMENEMNKLEEKYKKEYESKLQLANALATKASKARREADVRVVQQEEQSKRLMQELKATQEELRNRTKETQRLEHLLRKIHQQEAQWKSQVAGLKTKLKLQAEESHRGSKSRAVKPVPSMRFPLELLELDDDEDDIMKHQNSTPCQDCAQKERMLQQEIETNARLQHELDKCHRDMERLRQVHANELRVQVEAIQSVLKTRPSIQSA